MTSSLIKIFPAALAGLYILYALLAPLFSSLRKVPGPFYARFTNLFYLSRVRNGKFQHENVALHRKFGPLVRLGPNLVSIDDPSALKPIYGIGSKFPKSDWYSAWMIPGPGNFTLFADQDMARHADTRKHFQNLYSLSSLVSYETFVDQCADIFDKRLQEIADSREPMDMPHWFQCYAFDVIACITYGNRFGFLDHGHDIRGMMGDLHALFRYSTLVGIYVWLHDWIFHPAAKLQLFGARGRVTVMDFVKSQMTTRQEERRLRDAEDKEKGRAEDMPRDFLDRLLDQNEKDAKKMTMYHVLLVGNSNINAGSDTTATTLSGMLYFLMKHPRVMARLRQEIEEFSSEGRLSEQPRFRETQQMPYLDAVIKESLRLHSAVGLPLWRVVPEGGVTLSGQFLPQGTNVGISAWVAHRNEDVWGADAGEFRPERWTEAQAEALAGNKERLRRMEAYYLPFGLGSRTCIGRHISMLEMSKLMPRLLRDFEFELERPDEAWEIENIWFMLVKNLFVRVRRRAAASQPPQHSLHL